MNDLQCTASFQTTYIDVRRTVPTLFFFSSSTTTHLQSPLQPDFSSIALSSEHITFHNHTTHAMASTQAFTMPKSAGFERIPEDEVNPVAYALQHSWVWKHSPVKHSSSRNSSTTHTPAPSKPASVHESTRDEDINPWAYALEHSWLWKHSPVRSHSTTHSRSQSAAPSRAPSRAQTPAPSKRASVESSRPQTGADINPYAYALQNSWLWKHSPF